MATRMQQRRGTAQQWIDANPVLAPGEIGFEIDTNKFKIGDDVNHWLDLKYFSNNQALTNLIDGAPALLDTLNELAAAVNDDPNFFSTVATNLSNHQSDTTNIHGIADTAALATKAYADNAALTAVDNIVAGAPALLNTLDELAAAMGDDPAYLGTIADNLSALNTDFGDHLLSSTNVHGIADASQLATKSYSDQSKADAKSYADSEISTHNSDTTNVHGITDTGQLSTKAYADASVSTHNDDTTNVHGIFDTSVLETVSGSQSKIDSSLSTHNNDTLDVHGIANTANLSTKSYVDTEISDAISTEVTNRDSAINTHNLDTTLVHGIADTSALALLTDVSGAISTEVTNRNSAIGDAIADEVTDRNSAISAHNDDTTNVHGIANTANLATKSYVDTEISDAISTEVTNRDNAIGTHSDDTTNVHGILDTTVLATQDFVATAVGNATINQSELAGTGLAWDGVNEQFIIDGTVATKTYAAELLTGATKTNIVITGDQTGLFITAENGVADSTTSDLLEGTNLYFTNERAQDAVGLNVGLGLTYTDSTGEIKVNTSEIQSRVANVTDTEIGYLDGVTSSIQTQLGTKAPTADPTFTGTVSGVTKSMVGLGSVDNTADSAKPVSTAQQTALNLKADLASPALTGVPTAPTASAGTNTTQVATTAFVSGAVSDLVASAPGALNTLNELAVALGNDANFSTSVTNSIATKAPIASPTFTGTVAGITKSMVGLGNVDNTSDSAKPVSTATQTALDLKVNSADIAELAQDAVGTILSSDLSYNDSTPGIAVNYVTVGNTLLNGVSGSSYGLIGTSAYLDVKDTNGYNKEIELDITAVESKLVTDGFAKTSDIAEFAQDAVNTAIVAGAGLDKSYDDTANTITLDIDSTVVTLSGTQTLTNKTITSPSGLVKADVGLGNVDNTTDAGKPVSTATQTALDLKAPKAAPTFTGTLTAADVTISGNLTVSGTTTTVNTTNFTTSDPVIYLGDGNNANLVDIGFVGSYNDGTYAHQGLVKDSSDGKWKLFKGVTDEPTTTVNFAQGSLDALKVGAFEASSATIGNVSDTELQYLDGVTSAIQTQLNAKAPIASPTFTGTVSGITKSMVGLGSVDNTADSAKPISTATQTALDAKLASATAATTYAPIASPTFTGTVSGITKSMVGLGSVDNTADSAKPVSTATQTALDLKAPLASPTFTGTVTLPTGTVTSVMILDGTILDADINASAAIAQSKISGLSTSLGLKADLASPALTGTPTAPTAAAGTNTTQVATTAFVGTAVSNLVASAPAALDTLNELATALGNDASFSTTVTNSIATKAPIASPTFTGTATIPTLTLTNPLTAANGGTGLSSLGAGVATFLGTPSSANLAAMITDEIGTGNIVLSEIATTAPTAGSYTLVATDKAKLVELSGASANTLTVPLDSTLNFPTGTQIHILQVGTGQTTVAGASGVTINATPGLKIRAQWGGATLTKRGVNTWVLVGDLTV